MVAEATLDTLRSFAPGRPVTPTRAVALAELQATRLLKAADITAPSVPVEELATELLGIRVIHDDLPIPALVTTIKDGWLIALRAGDAPTRRRFSCAHELGHILYDDCTGRRRSHAGHGADERAELLCNLFAACVLMPRAWVKADWASRGIQDVGRLARRYQVSWAAMNFRLDQLGLQAPRPRCGYRRRIGAAA